VHVLLVVLNSDALEPDSENVARPDVCWPVFVSVNVLEAELPGATEPKSQLVGLSARRAAVIPVPESAADAVPPGDAVAETVAAFDPVLVGANRKPIRQVAPAAKEPVQALDAMLNWVGFAPEREATTVPDVTPPTFLTVTDWVADVEPTPMLPKLRLEGVIVSRACGRTRIDASVCNAVPRNATAVTVWVTSVVNGGSVTSYAP
jgi:hypothetical protein